jgi:hypothetical protein
MNVSRVGPKNALTDRRIQSDAAPDYPHRPRLLHEGDRKSRGHVRSRGRDARQSQTYRVAVMFRQVRHSVPEQTAPRAAMRTTLPYFQAPR